MNEYIKNEQLTNRAIEILGTVNKIGVIKPNASNPDVFEIAQEIVYLMAGYNLSSIHAKKALELAGGLVESHSILCRKEATADTMANEANIHTFMKEREEFISRTQAHSIIANGPVIINVDGEKLAKNVNSLLNTTDDKS